MNQWAKCVHVSVTPFNPSHVCESWLCTSTSLHESSSHFEARHNWASEIIGQQQGQDYDLWHLVLPEQSLGQYSSPSFVQRLGDYGIEVRFVTPNLICSKPQHASVDLYASRHYSKLVAEHIHRSYFPDVAMLFCYDQWKNGTSFVRSSYFERLVESVTLTLILIHYDKSNKETVL